MESNVEFDLLKSTMYNRIGWMLNQQSLIMLFEMLTEQKFKFEKEALFFKCLDEQAKAGFTCDSSFSFSAKRN